MRISANVEQFETSLKHVVLEERPISWFQYARPAAETLAAEVFKACLFPEDSVLWTTERGSDGLPQRVPSNLSRALDAILACRSWLPGGTAGLVHWCEMVPGSGGSGGVSTGEWTWCCSSQAEARAKIHASIHDWLLGVAWLVGADNRWTVQPINQRRILVSDTVDEVFTHTLTQIHIMNGLQNAGLVQSLIRLIEGDRENWKARNKVRFHNIFTALCAGREFGLRPNARLAVVVTASRRLDDMLYSYLGRKGVTERVTLGTMLNPSTSPLLQAQTALLYLLQHFSPDTEEWGLLNSMGTDFEAAEIRSFARMQAIGFQVDCFSTSSSCGASNLIDPRCADSPARLQDTDNDWRRSSTREIPGASREEASGSRRCYLQLGRFCESRSSYSDPSSITLLSSTTSVSVLTQSFGRK